MKIFLIFKKLLYKSFRLLRKSSDVSCTKDFGLKEGLIITRDYEANEKREGIKIKFIPLWKWLLEQ